MPVSNKRALHKFRFEYSHRFVYSYQTCLSISGAGMSSSQNVRKLIIKGPRFVPFEVNITQFGAKPDIGASGTHDNHDVSGSDTTLARSQT